MDDLPKGPLANPRGPPDPPDMLTERVNRLQDDLKEVRADMKAVLSELGYLRGRADHTPTTWVMVTTLLASQATLLGLVFAMLKLLGH